MRCIQVHSSRGSVSVLFQQYPCKGSSVVITRQYIVWRSFLWRGAVALLRPGRSNEMHRQSCQRLPTSAAFLKMPYSTCMLARGCVLPRAYCTQCLIIIIQTEALGDRRGCAPSRQAQAQARAVLLIAEIHGGSAAKTTKQASPGLQMGWFTTKMRNGNSVAVVRSVRRGLHTGIGGGGGKKIGIKLVDRFPRVGKAKRSEASVSGDNCGRPRAAGTPGTQPGRGPLLSGSHTSTSLGAPLRLDGAD